MSAQEQIRAMLDELMGTSRDGDAHRQRVRFDDPRVCKSFLLGCCPHEILSSTRMDLGECPKYHDLALKADYEIASKNKDYFYDIDALEHLENFIAECDRKVDLAKRRLKETQEELSEEAAAKAEMIHGLGEHIGTNLAKAEEVGAEGDVEASLKLMAEIEDLKKVKAQAEIDYRNSMPASSYQQQKLRVCEVCSAYLGIHDNDRRLADHFGGKLHLGFITIRQKLDDLKKTVQDRRAQREREREDRRKELDRKDLSLSANKSRDRVQQSSRSREPARSGSKEPVRSKSKERVRSRSRERRRRSGSRHRRRSRSRSGGRRRRSRSRSRDRRRKRSRTRSRSRSRRSRSRSRSRRSTKKSSRRSRSRSRSRRSDSKSKRSRRSHSGSRRKSRSRSRDRRSRDKSRDKSTEKSRDKSPGKSPEKSIEKSPEKSRERSRERSSEKCSSKDIESERRNGEGGSMVTETDSTADDQTAADDQVASVDSTSLSSFQVTAE